MSDLRGGEPSAQRTGSERAVPASLHADFFDRLADAILLTDERGAHLDVNLSAANLLGYSRAELLRLSLSDIAIADPGQTTQQLRNFVEAGYWRGEMELQRKDGSSVIVEARGSAVEGPEGQLFVLILRELEERPHHALRTTESRLAAIVESSEDAIFSKTLDGEIRSWNAAAERMYGYSADEVVGRSVMMLAPPDRKEEIAGILDRLARGEAIQHFVTKRVTKDGRDIEVSLSVSPVRDSSGRIVGASTIARDITEQRLAEAELRMARQQLAIITRAGADGITIQDAEGRRVYANDAAARLSGYADAQVFLSTPVEEVLARFEMLREDGSPFPLEELPGRRALQGEADPEALVLVRDRIAGTAEWTRIRATPMLDDDGVVRYVVNVFHHITDQKRVEEQLRFQKVLLEAQSEASEVGVAVISEEGEIVSANRRFGEMWGIPPDVLATRSNAAAMDAIRDRLADPEGFRERSLYLWEHGDAEARDEIPLTDGRIIERFTKPLRDDAGGSHGRVAFFRDVTEDRTREDRQRFLAQSTKELVSSLDYGSTLSRIAAMAVPRLADWCAVDVLEPDGSIELLALVHTDPSKVARAREFRRRFPVTMSDPRGIPNVIRTGTSELYPTIDLELLRAAALDQDQLDFALELQLSSVMIVPLRARGRTLGTLSFVWAESGRSYTEDDLTLAEDLASRAALALDNARLYRERDEIARTLQSGLLPGPLPEVPGLELAARYQAAGEGLEVGGDFYDAFDTEDGGWALVVGDVCGKGPTAAALMGAARHTIRAAAIRDRRPSVVLNTLNAALQQQAHDQWFCTVCYVRLRREPGGVRLTVCVGGHPLPAILRADGRLEFPGKPGTLLGVFPDVELTDSPADLGPGDALVLFTDGLTDVQRDGKDLAQQQVAELLSENAGRSAQTIAERLEAAVLEQLPGGLVDDLAILVARVNDR